MFLRRTITDETTVCWNCSELAEGIVCESCGVVIRSVLRRRKRRRGEVDEEDD